MDIYSGLALMGTVLVLLLLAFPVEAFLQRRRTQRYRAEDAASRLASIRLQQLDVHGYRGAVPTPVHSVALTLALGEARVERRMDEIITAEARRSSGNLPMTAPVGNPAWRPEHAQSPFGEPSEHPYW